MRFPSPVGNYPSPRGDTLIPGRFQYLALVFKGLSKTQLNEVMNGLTDLRNITPQVEDALNALGKTKQPSCETFLQAYILYHAYHKAYYRARTGLDWVFAWHLAAEEVLNPLEPALREWKKALDAASDAFYQQTAFGREGRVYHNTHCKHIESGWFSGAGQVGYCKIC